MMDTVEKYFLIESLREHGNNKTNAAKSLGITREGLAVILTSDTLEETIGLSHTLLVMRDGKITHRTDAKPGHKPRQVDLIGHMV